MTSSSSAFLVFRERRHDRRASSAQEKYPCAFDWSLQLAD